jgi:murein DD-endopeptidase MepM/ murein hydrolase activator NlpD
MHPKRYIVFGLIALLFALVSILFWESRQLQMHIAKVQELQAQYESYIASVQTLIARQKKGEAVSGQLLLNRSLGSIKASPEMHSLNRYTQQTLDAIEREKALKKDEAVCNVSQDSKQHTSPRLKTKQEKRPLLTDILFTRPMKRSHYWLSSYFGPRKKPNGQWGFHYGLDMAANRGTPIKSVAAGEVQIAESASGYGNTIMIVHDDVYKTRYAHLDEILVTVGQRVQQGDLIGKVGDTGFTRKMGKDASHLHLELYENGTQVDPMHVIDI